MIPLSKDWRLMPSPVLLLLFLGFIFSCTSDKIESVDSLKVLTGLGYGINSSTLVVRDIDSTKKHFTEVLGFKKPVPKGVEKGPFAGGLSFTYMFPDMSSLELLSVEDSITVAGRDSFIVDFLQQHEGVRKYALSSSSADSTHAWLSSRGFELDSVRAYDRFGSGII